MEEVAARIPGNQESAGMPHRLNSTNPRQTL